MHKIDPGGVKQNLSAQINKLECSNWWTWVLEFKYWRFAED